MQRAIQLRLVLMRRGARWTGRVVELTAGLFCVSRRLRHKLISPLRRERARESERELQLVTVFTVVACRRGGLAS